MVQKKERLMDTKSQFYMEVTNFIKRSTTGASTSFGSLDDLFSHISEP
jgi:hypothetical protein